MSEPPLIGGCECGAVRYECDAAPSEIFMFRCHCRTCQRLSGGPYAAVLFVPARSFRVTRGAIRRHPTEGEQGPHIRGFCAACGTRLTGGEGPGENLHIGFTATSLDEPGVFHAQCDLWTCDAQPWDPLDPAVPHFEKSPPS